MQSEHHLTPLRTDSLIKLYISPHSKTRWVLRKKPAGQLLSRTAHQVEREFKVLSALHRHNQNPYTASDQKVPVPEPIILCEDVSVLGTPFYIMEFLEGRIFTNTRMLEVSSQDRREWYPPIICVTRTLN